MTYDQYKKVTELAKTDISVYEIIDGSFKIYKGRKLVETVMCSFSGAIDFAHRFAFGVIVVPPLESDIEK